MSSILTFCNRLGAAVLRMLDSLGAVTLFMLDGLRHIFSSPRIVPRTIQQLYVIGYKSLFVILLIGIFCGMVLGLQGYYTLVQFGSVGMLGSAVSLSLIRELGPVLTAIMLAGAAVFSEAGRAAPLGALPQAASPSPEGVLKGCELLTAGAPAAAGAAAAPSGAAGAPPTGCWARSASLSRRPASSEPARALSISARVSLSGRPMPVSSRISSPGFWPWPTI